MITRKRLAICLILVVFSSALSAQNERDIVAKHRQALGEMLNESANHTFIAKGTIAASGVTFPVSVYWRLPRTMFLEMKMGSISVTMIRNDSTKWDYNSLTKKHRISTPQDPKWHDEDAGFFIHSELLNYKSLGYKLSLVRRCELDSLEVFQLQLSKKERDPITIFIDTKTYLIYKVLDEAGVQYYANYQLNGSFVFPRFILLSRKGLETVFNYDSVAFNVQVPDSIFVIPDQIPDTEEPKKSKPRGVVNNERTALDKGDHFYEKGQYDSAIRCYTQSLNQKGNSFRAFNSRGLANLKIGEYYDALVDFNRASELVPDSWAARNNIGLSKYYLGDYTNAIKDFERALQLDPRAENAMLNRGMSYFNMKEYEKAAKDFSQLVSQNPRKGEWNFRLGTALAQLKKYEEALVSYRAALAYDYINADVLNYKGVSHHNLEQYDSAILNYSSALERDPETLIYIENLGRAFYDADQFEKAQKYFERYLDRKPTDARIHNLSGLCKYKDENYKGAIKDFTKAIELNSKEAIYFDNRASAKAEIDDYDGAIADYGESIRLYPNDASIFFRRGMLKIYTSKKLEGCMDLGTAHEMKYEPAKDAIMKNCN